MDQTTAEKKKFKIKEKIKLKVTEILNNILPSIIRYLSRELSRINEKAVIDNPDQLEDFGPVILAADEDKHSVRIKYAIDNPVILNLALTGPMGSGKSTILRTFENKYKEFKCLNISLATFDEKTLDTDKIEHKILKQLFYSVEHSRIPESRFKRIENLKGIKLKTLLFVLWLCSAAYFIKTDVFDVLKETLHLDYHSAFLSVLYGLYFALYSFVLVNKLMSFILNFKLSKFKIKDVDFDNNQDSKTVNFENEIDEILYFFERNPVEIIFFQDLDRFDKTEIFIKLREINSLINNYEPIKKKRKVTFIYAVCDDIFKENERAKFFDFIIPVIPVINYTSSSSKLLSKMKMDLSDKKLSKDFIDDVSLYLNDYRTIKSIFNEFQIYKSIIGGQLENYNNLLAMMIYKNIEPTDFEKLNQNEGYVYNVIENCKELTSEKIQDYDKKISDLTATIEKAKAEKIKDINELRMVYLLKFCELNITKNEQPVFAFHLEHKKVDFKEVLKVESFDRFRDQNNIQYYYSTYSGVSNASISFTDVEKAVGRLSYRTRLQIILNQQTEIQNSLRTELEEMKIKHRELNTKKLFEVLDAGNSAAYFAKHSAGNEHLNNIKLVNYLLRGGYINEEYNHYISHFHPGSIAKEDNDFLLSLLPSEKALPYGHALKEVKSLFKRIKPENFSNAAILNLSLTDYLIENKKSARLNQIIGIIGKEGSKSAVFMDEYMNHADEEYKTVFFRSAAERWDGMWNYIAVKSNSSAEKIELYLVRIFQYLDQTLISAIDKEGSLPTYIAAMEDLSCFYRDGTVMESFKQYIKKNKIRFENLKYAEQHNELFEFMYDNCLYAINIEMIEFFIANFNQSNIDIGRLQTENYTAVRSSGRSALIKYVDENPDQYIENVLLKLENNSNESQDSLCALLNMKDAEKRFDLVEHGRFSITDLSRISESDIQENLIYYEKIDVTWKNLLAYFKNVKEVDETLVNYLDQPSNYGTLSQQGLIKDPDESLKSEFQEELINSSISDESFDKIAVNLPFHYGNIEGFENIGPTKIKSMIVSKCVKLTEKNYAYIREKYSDLLLLLFEINAAEAVREIEKYSIDSNLYLLLLKSISLSTVQKMDIIKKAPDEILAGDTELLAELGIFLSANRISPISYNLIFDMIKNADTEGVQNELFNKYFSFIGDENLKEVTGEIAELSKLNAGRHPKVENNEVNRELAKKLQGKLVSKFKPIEEGRKIELIPYGKPRIG